MKSRAGVASLVALSCLAAYACVGDSGNTVVASDGGGGADGSMGGGMDAGGGNTTDANAADGSMSGTDSGPTACTDASDTSSDSKNCGRCGHACTGTFTCTQGKCGNEVAEVAQGSNFGCVALHEGSVYCWGSTEDGVLGIEPSAADNVCGATHCRATPQKIAGLSNIKHIAAGSAHACAIDGAGAVMCWGKNDVSQLAKAASAHSSTPVAVSIAGNPAVAQISLGQDVTCARTTSKDVYCWGNNTVEATGQTNATNPVVTPSLVPVFNHDVSDVKVSMSVGSEVHACAIREPGTVWCWGEDSLGEGGRNVGAAMNDACGGNCNSAPIQAGTISNVTSLSVGPGSTCALTGGTVQCWGGFFYAQLGTLTNTNSATPSTVTGLPTNTITTLTQGAFTQFGLTGSGDVWAWGAVNGASYGDGDTGGADAVCPGGNGILCRANGAVEQVTNLTGISQVSFHYDSGLALKKDGSVVAWGANDSAQLGHLPNATGAGDQTCGTSPCHSTPAVVTLP